MFVALSKRCVNISRKYETRAEKEVKTTKKKSLKLFPMESSFNLHLFSLCDYNLNVIFLANRCIFSLYFFSLWQISISMKVESSILHTIRVNEDARSLCSTIIRMWRTQSMAKESYGNAVEKWVSGVLDSSAFIHRYFVCSLQFIDFCIDREVEDAQQK